MPSIQEIRQSYPQYSDLSDEQLLSGLHRRFYSDMPFQDFMGRISIGEPAQAEPAGPQQLPVPERGFFGTVGARAGDVAGSLVSGAGGIASGVGGLAGMATGGFDNPLSRAGRGIREYGESLMSPELQNKKAAFAQALSQAESQGFAAEAATAARELVSNPGLLASMAIEQIPQFLASFGIGRGAVAIGQRVGRTAEAGRRAGVGAAIGSAAGLQGGDIAGQTYEDVLKLPAETMQQSPAYRELLATMSPQEARESLATRAGREAGLMAGGLSAATTALLPSVERAAFSKNLSRSAIARALGTGAGEAVGEAIEEGGGQAAQNIAASRADTERDLMRGVGGAAATGAILGGAMGAGVGAISAPSVDLEEARRAELRGAIGEVVGAREPAPEAQLALPREVAEYEVPGGTLTRTQAENYVARMERERFPEIANVEGWNFDDKFRYVRDRLEQEQQDIVARRQEAETSPERIVEAISGAQERLTDLNANLREARIRLGEAQRRESVDPIEVRNIQNEIRDINQQVLGQKRNVAELQSLLPTGFKTADLFRPRQVQPEVAPTPVQQQAPTPSPVPPPEVAPVAEEQPPAPQPPAPEITPAPAPITPAGSFNVPVGQQYTVRTPDNSMAIDVVPEVVDLSTLIAATGRYQNRDITQKANQQTISKIENAPDFTQLTTTPFSDRGTPVVGADNIIEVGNHRVEGLKRAAQNNPEGFAKYASDLRAAGYDTTGMQFPVLIRRRVTELDSETRSLFVRLSNAGSSQSLNEVEIAKQDAQLLTPELLAKFDGEVTGGVAAAKNAPFVRDFLSKITTPDEFNKYLTAQGSLSSSLEDRINNALFAYAYDDDILIKKAIEKKDDDSRSITSGMIAATGAMNALKRGIESGRIRPEFDIVPSLVTASDRIRAGKNNGMSPGDVLNSEDMLNPMPQIERSIIRLLSNDSLSKIASATAIGKRLKAYVEEVKTQTPDPDLMGGQRVITPEEAVVTALNPGQPAMFSARRMGEQAQEQGETQAEEVSPSIEKSRTIIKKYLADLRGKGKQGRLLANSLEKLLNDRRFNADQIYAAFTIDNAILKTIPKDAAYRFNFLEDIIVDNAEAAKATGAKVGDRAQARVIKPTASLPGFIEISLAEDMLPILNETAAHEAFHVLQDYFGAFDKGFNSLLAKSFEDGITLDQLEPSIKRRLQGLKAPNSDKSYFAVLKEGLGNNPLSVREAQAYAFGALTDAAMRGQKVTGLTAPFQRFFNFVRDTFSKIRSGLRGDGYQTAADLLAGAGARAEGFTQAAPTEGGTEYSGREAPAQTQTENFKKWFKDSKVVDAEGEPLVVYHGTRTGGFNEFKPNFRKGEQLGFGMHFASNRDFAQRYAEDDNVARRGKSPQVYDTYLSIQNPLNADSIVYEGTKEFDLASRLAGSKLFTQKSEDGRRGAYMQNAIDSTSPQRAEKLIKEAGYDGVVYRSRIGQRTPYGSTYSGESQSFIVFEPQQIKSATGNRGTFSESEKRIDYSARKAPSYSAQKPSAPPGTAKSFYQTVIKDVDNSSVLDRILSKILDKKGGESIGSAIARTSINQAAPLYNLDKMARAEGYTGLDASKALEMSMSNSGRIAQMLSVGMGKIDPKTGVISLRNDVKPLLQIMKEAGIANNEGMKEQLQAYLAALRERDLRAAGRKGFTNQTIQAVTATIKEAEAKHPEWKKTAAELDKLNQALIDWAMATGLVTKQQARTLKDKFYTPFYREDYEYVTNAVGRELKGGEKALNDLFGNIILNADSIMKAGLKNLATKTAIETMEFVKLAKPNTSDKKNDNTITFKVNGKPTNYDVEDAVLFSALSVMPRQMIGGIYQTMAKMAAFFRDMVTVAPSFIIANLYRGKISAFVQEGQPLTTNTFAGMRDALNASTSLQNFQLQTGFGGLDYGMGARNMAEAFERKLNDQGIIKSLSKGKVIQSMKEAFSKMQELSEASEMAERIKLAENLIKKGMKPQDAYFQGYMLAPYTRKGTGEGWVGQSIQFLMPLVPFLNAKIQTTYRLIENEKGDKQKLWTLGLPQQIFLRGLVVTAFSLMAYGLNLAEDEDEWDKIPNHMKMEYDIIPFMGNYITLPKAFEIGKIFGSLPVFILDAIRRGEGKDLTEALIEVGKSTFWMNPMPKAVDPIIAAVTNYDFFRGRPLETKGDEALPVQERINRSTTKTGEALSAVVNTVFGNVLSPIKAQALLDGYTGTLGVTIMSGFDSLLAASGAIPGKPAGAFGDPATMPAILANSAGLNRFYRENDMMVSRFVGDFYKIKEMTDQLVRSESLARQSNDFQRLQELRGEEGLPLRMRQTVSAAGTQISEINKRIRMIERQDIDGVSKAEAIQPLIERRDRIAKRVVDQARSLGAF